MKRRVRILHWNPDGVRTPTRQLRDAGYTVNNHTFRSGADLKALRSSPPDVVIIDLDRIPSNGREVALALRASASTRHVPLVFAGGDADKVRGIKRLLPDATYTSWRGIRGAVKRALRGAVSKPLSPGPMAGYSGTPLPRKLGIKPDTTVAFVNAPNGFAQVLGELPKRVRIVARSTPRADLVIWFVKELRTLESGIERMRANFADGGALWIAWPKQASKVTTDVTQTHVRNTGLANGLVDYKIAAIDATWSGLKFARRR